MFHQISLRPCELQGCMWWTSSWLVFMQHARKLFCRSSLLAVDKWAEVVSMVGTRFETLVRYWIGGTASSQPLLVIFFEDMIRDLEGELRKMADFLNVDFSEKRLRCVLENRKGLYKRVHPPGYDELDPFTPAMIKEVNSHIRRAALVLPRVKSFIRQ